MKYLKLVAEISMACAGIAVCKWIQEDWKKKDELATEETDENLKQFADGVMEDFTVEF